MSAAKKNLFELTKKSSEIIGDLNKQEVERKRNLSSNIQWGVKAQDATAIERFSGKSAEPNSTAALLNNFQTMQ